ncbi:MAG TPA: YkgJ family cysteine cluster protein [Aggregatilineales bacterium]|nr:YkgJ family cysteine cluster protein [Anaerolineales bacterium]HRE49739.1 YkgJ family cysteine cluster protein [Aggregatilineales bacterium]
MTTNRPIPPDAPIRLAEGARHRCRQCGSSCRNFTVSLSDAEAQRLALEVWRPLLHNVPPDLPFVSREGNRYILTKRPEALGGGCVFLGADNLCVIHKEAGMAVKPLACQVFPLQGIAAPDGVHLSVNSGCRRLWEVVAAADDPPLDPLEARELLSAAAGMLSMAETVRLTAATMILYTDFLAWQGQIAAILCRPAATLAEFWGNLRQTAALILTIADPADESLPADAPLALVANLIAAFHADLEGERSESPLSLPRQALTARVMRWLPAVSLPLKRDLPEAFTPSEVVRFCLWLAGQFLQGRQAAYWTTARGAWAGLVIALAVGLNAFAGAFDQHDETFGHSINDLFSDALTIFGLPSSNATWGKQQAMLVALSEDG